MHPKIVYPGELAPVLEELRRPRHSEVLRDSSRSADSQSEVALGTSFTIDSGDFADESHLSTLLDDLRLFLSHSMQVTEADDGYVIRLRRGKPTDSPDDVYESHSIDVQGDACEIVAADMDALRRAVFWLEDEMLARRAAILPRGKTARWTRIKTRISRCPIAPYRWLSGWELDENDQNDYYPDAYLQRLSACGVNGLWVPGLLRIMIASQTIPEMGPESHRLERLKSLVAKAAKYGIRIYLFCIEPRALGDGHPAALAHPEILGPRDSLCTSQPIVREYIREIMRTLFTEVPDLAGVINIFNGERTTNCVLNDEYAAQCPRCSKRPRNEVLAETLDAFLEGIREVSPTAEFMGWTYMMGTLTETRPIAPMLDVMNRSRSDVIWLGNFEHGSTKELCGKTVHVHEYSLSCVGPSEYFVDLAKEARASGRQIYAKLQIGTSFELSSVPHIPVPGVVYDKFQAAQELGVTGTMLGWIPGGFPGPMLKAAGEAAFEPLPDKDTFLKRIAAIDWGESPAQGVAEAWNQFGDIWQLYPFDNSVLYWGPLTRGASYQLHLEREPRLAKPYNWGLERTRKVQPFEDQYERWLGQYTLDEIVTSLRNMADQWLPSLEKLQAGLNGQPDRERLQREVAVATVIRLQCLTAANVYEFYSLRDQLREADPADHPALLKQIHEVVSSDLEIAKQVRQLITVEPIIGFQSEIYAYSFSIPLIDEKILQVQDVLKTIEQWQQHGVDKAILDRTVEEAEGLRPDRMPDYWGD